MDLTTEEKATCAALSKLGLDAEEIADLIVSSRQKSKGGFVKEKNADWAGLFKEAIKSALLDTIPTVLATKRRQERLTSQFSLRRPTLRPGGFWRR